MIVQSVNKRTFAKSPRPDIDSEAGTSGASLADLYMKKPKKKVSVEDLRYMKDNDGTVKSLYQILRMPIMANTWRLDRAEYATEAQAQAAQEQADFVESNFLLPPHRGGMSTPFRLVLARMLKAVVESHALAEKVFTINEQGKIVYRKIAFRDITQITLLRDEKGGFAGYKQSYYDQTTRKIKDVTVPVEYCFLYTYNKDEDEVYGQSAFHAAFYHWDRKRRLYYLYEQAVEKGAMPPKMLEVLEGNEDSDSKKSSNLAAMTNFGIDSAVLVPTGYALKPYDAGKGRIDPMPGIDHHNAEMARSVLAQFILLGSTSDTGSFALSKSHADIFMMALRGMMAEIEEHINSYLIPQLINYNYDTPYYPEFHFNDMTDDTASFIESIFTEIAKKSETKLPQSFLDGLVKKVAERLDIDMDELEQVDQGDQTDAALSKKNRRSSRRFATGDVKWRRDLTEAEQTVSLAAIEDKIISQEQKFINSIRSVYDKVTEQALADIAPIVEGGDITKLDDLQLQFADEYTQAIVDESLATYNAGKKITADDLDVKIPATPKETKDYFKQNAASVTEKQFGDLLFTIKAKVTSEFHKGQLSKTHTFGIEEINAELLGDFDAFFESKIGLTGSIIVSEAINRARDDIFTTAAADIAVYQYSAILDENTCELCEQLDRSIVNEQEYRASTFQPPIHHLCRCIWIAIKKDQSTIPAETGIPDISDEVIDQNQTLSHKH